MNKKVPYFHDTNLHNGKSASEVVPLIIKLLHPNSVIDLGCGLGDWLYEFQKNGVEEILGIDGNWVNKEHLFIDKAYFLEKDLTTVLNLNKRFDLAISLEVAEHLPESTADLFIKTLTSLSDNIVFSAAIPHQGGQYHLNEQWHDYWILKFKEHGFHCHDSIRPLIWNNKKIDWWYKQNTYHFTKNTSKKLSYINIVHPENFEEKILAIQNIFEGKIGIRQALKIFINSIYQYFKNG